QVGQLLDSTAARAGDGAVRGGLNLFRRALDRHPEPGPRNHRRVVTTVADGDRLRLWYVHTLAQELQGRRLVALDAGELEIGRHGCGRVEATRPTPARLWQQGLQDRARGDDDELRRRGAHRLIEVAHDVDLHARMPGIFMRLGAVALDEQLIVAIRLDVQVAFAPK